MTKPVAIAVHANPATRKHPSDVNQTGQWQLISQMEETTPSIHAAGTRAVLTATATFSYVGGTVPTPGGPAPLPPIPAPPLLLQPAHATRLTAGGRAVLVEGDEVEDAFGNQLVVSKTADQLGTG